MKVAEKNGTKIIVKFSFPYGDTQFNETLQLVKNIPGSAFDRNARCWYLPLDPIAYDSISNAGFSISKSLQEWHGESLPSEKFKCKIKIDGLRQYQNEGVAFLEKFNGRGIIADEMGCISGDASIHIFRNKKAINIPLRKLYSKFNGIDIENKNKWDMRFPVRTFSKTDENEVIKNIIRKVLYKGSQYVHYIKTETKFLTCTIEHKIFTDRGEVPFSQLFMHDKIWTSHNGVLKLEKIIDMGCHGEQDVYDIVMESPYHNFVANGIVVHNCGKTPQTIAWFNLHKDKRPVIVVCPATIKQKWKQEITTWSDITEEEIILLSGKTPLSIPKDKKVVIINYDIASSWIQELISFTPKVLVLDELHYIKADKTNRTKAIKTLGRSCPHIIGLSGTPVENRPIEFFNPLNLIRSDIFPNKFKYALKYCAAKKSRWGWDMSGSSNRGELHDILTKTVMIRRTKSEVLKDLPDKQYALVPVAIENMTEYEEAESDILKWVQENEGDEKLDRARNAQQLVKINKLQRIASKGKKSPAISWIDDFLDENEAEKLVVFCYFTDTIDFIHEKFKDISIKIDGSTPVGKRQPLIDEFTNNENLRLAIINIEIAIGFNLTVASHALFIERTFVPADIAQAGDRLHRFGQKKSVTLWHLVAAGTFDETIIGILQRKMRIINEIIDGKDGEEAEETVVNEILSQIRRKRLEREKV